MLLVILFMHNMYVYIMYVCMYYVCLFIASFIAYTHTLIRIHKHMIQNIAISVVTEKLLRFRFGVAAEHHHSSDDAGFYHFDAVCAAQIR